MNEQLIVAIIERLETSLEVLVDKIQPGAVDAQTSLPYAAYRCSETPIRTMNGIVGFNTNLELAVYDSSALGLENLKSKVIASLDGFMVDVWRLLYSEGEYVYEQEYDVHGYILKFNIKN